MKLVYLRTDLRNLAWDVSIGYFERSLAKTGLTSFDNEPWKWCTLIGKLLAKTRLLRHLHTFSEITFFTPLMGPMERRLFPTCYFSRSIVYCYDCWPPVYDWWEQFFKRHRIELAFFSARQSAEHFAARLLETECIWLAEATDPSAYDHSKPLADRKIDVLELGRRYGAYHVAIAPALAKLAQVHLYERKKGHVIFPSPELLVRGLADTKISICFPSSLTHPERSGTVETVTHRYFESMAAKCLLVGHCPRELEDLYGYNPVVEVDWSDPSGQMIEILASVDAYQQLVDKNYANLLRSGSWDARVRTMLEFLTERGYRVSQQD